LACGAETPRDSISSRRPAVLLFKGGRVIDGEVEETATHYVVYRSLGRVEVPRRQVEFVGNDLEDVYLHKAARIPGGDADQHLRLAEWCMLVGLHDHAIEHWEQVAELSGDPQKAQRMIESLERLRSSAAQSAKNRSGARPPRAPSATLGVLSTAPSPKQLSQAQVSSFTVKVQPLLVRNCSNAGCHDSSHPGSFILQRSTRPTPFTTQQNLRSVLALIDPQDPENSPLLVQALYPHGDGQQSFRGFSIKDPAVATLVDWVMALAAKAKPEPLKGKSTSDAVASRDLPAAEPMATDPADDTVPAQAPAPGASVDRPAGAAGIKLRITPHDSVPEAQPTPDPVGRAERQAPGATRPTRAADDYRPVDPFDPEIFNRRYAQRAAAQEP
jgi:hypothetical protein